MHFECNSRFRANEESLSLFLFLSRKVTRFRLISFANLRILGAPPRSRSNVIILQLKVAIAPRNTKRVTRAASSTVSWARETSVLLRAAISGEQLPEYRVPSTNLTNGISAGATSEQGTRGIRPNYDTAWRSVINRRHRRRTLSTARNLEVLRDGFPR